jgi:uncharacterized protein YdcH (DUF465 family)|tara:strand:+ start:6668 stop:6874 length:207 start_codon:yes stop_codon:yes gene_type:complete
MNSNDEGLRERLEFLENKHRALDKHIEECYTNRVDNITLSRLKTEKLWLKDEIHRIATELDEWNVNTM